MQFRVGGGDGPLILGSTAIDLLSNMAEWAIVVINKLKKTLRENSNIQQSVQRTILSFL